MVRRNHFLFYLCAGDKKRYTRRYEFDRHADARASACRSDRLHGKTVYLPPFRDSSSGVRANHRLHKDPYSDKTDDVFFQLSVVKNRFVFVFGSFRRTHNTRRHSATLKSRVRALSSSRNDFTRSTIDVGNVPRLPIYV